MIRVLAPFISTTESLHPPNQVVDSSSHVTPFVFYPATHFLTPLTPLTSPSFPPLFLFDNRPPAARLVMTSFPCDPICVSGIARLTPTRTSPGGSSNRALPLFQTPSHLRSPSSIHHNDECCQLKPDRRRGMNRAWLIIAQSIGSLKNTPQHP
ncbi:uncharacterized protein BO87DRAFT_399508 [Aspergillus neoniger CBS 115656]|uniref:Uncharacterized protein n=1 Tax=Aspergillus neoniger (strain CBS 115656) TaxID=1448310 RepID=A0A318Z2V6_ASPNB|nr:hypothetical protein BO87DRAFT_399508 [Aspergillus neoniger CBS 115656]PYH31372.1 hypothetical protein BO87DRAFT_399508 [Aspergillus neoniger CBS 115656]